MALSAQVEPKGNNGPPSRNPRYINKYTDYSWSSGTIATPILETVSKKSQPVKYCTIHSRRVKKETNSCKHTHAHTASHTNTKYKTKQTPRLSHTSSGPVAPSCSYKVKKKDLKVIFLSSFQLTFQQHLAMLNTPCVFKWYLPSCF